MSTKRPVKETALSLIYQALLVMVGNALTQYISRWKYIKVLASWMAGIALIGFSLRLANNIK
jgi:threonine/homoserine/homoserine lactone efflux protein